jgi:aspartyl-tRNA(Asn)/glutamyl-tRNA(Gln) amidotransferase subunit A
VDARLAAGDDLGPLMGVPIGVKDLCEVEGMPLTAGSALDADVLHSIVGAEGSLVSALKAAGCVILGKTKTTEWAFSPTGINRTKGTPMNPADAAVSRLPGGSSAGSAVATAAGLAAFAIGSDTGGSVRVPSALCGVVGIKTTIGLPGWGTDGVFQLSSTFDTMGPLAKSAADVALVLSALGEPTQPAPVPEPTSLRIGRATNAVLWEGCDEHVLRSVERALELLKAAGATVVDVELPCVGEVDRAAILPTELLDFIGELLESFYV